jgi:Ca2+-binding RTX toxin-like protein
VAVLKNVEAAALVASNLGYSPTGVAAEGLTLTGGDGDDILAGGDGNDIIETGGAAFRNRVQAGGGNDSVTGGDGRDDVYGESGDDTIRTGGGGDYLNGGGGNDLLYAGEGNDTLRDETGGTDQSFGEGGDDFITISRSATAPLAGTSTMSGGEGNDTLTVNILNGGTAFVHGDAGGDIVRIDALTGAAFLTLGSGRDMIDLSFFSKSATNTAIIEVTDFAAGRGGDRIELAAFASRNLTGWASGSNRFESGHMRLLEDGADTHLQFDRNGGGDLFVTFLTLKNVDAASLTAFNLGGFVAAGEAHDGTGGDLGDLLFGEEAADRIEGQGGADRLYGFGGDDVLDGGLGDDFLNGGAGEDHLIGGEGSDRFTSGAGDDLVEGGGGNDIIFDSGSGSDILDGGDGDDEIEVLRNPGTSDIPTLIGGDGDDVLTVRNAGTAGTIVDAGAGVDSVYLSGGAHAVVTLGAGRDLLQVQSRSATVIAANVLDFEVGPSGDVLDLSALASLGGLGWDPATNPFQTKTLKLVQSGADTHILIDTDSNTGSFTYALWIILKDVDLWTLTAENFGGYQPPVTRGGSGDDVLQGGAGIDWLDGGEGNDTLRIGYGENDEARGGAGDDTVVVSTGGSAPRHKVDGGSGTDTLLLRGTADNVAFTLGLPSSFWLPGIEAAGIEKIALVSGFDAGHGTAHGRAIRYDLRFEDNYAAAGTTIALDTSGLLAGEIASVDATQERDAFLRVTGGAGSDRVWAGRGGSELEGFGGVDALFGGAGDDILRGGAGDDQIEDTAGNGSGTDLLDGGEGGDAITLTRSATAAWTRATVLGGEGNDGILVRLFGAGTNGTAIVDAGAGDDTVQVGGVAGTLTVTLGTGLDTLLFTTLTGVAGVAKPMEVTDFNPGEGDWILWGGALGAWLNRPGGAPTNPFLAGEARIVQDGADAVLEVLHLATGSFVTVVRFRNSDAAAFTGETLGGYALAALEGSDGADTLTGSRLADHIFGGSGDDLIRADQGGADLVRGGDGDDVLYFGRFFNSSDDVAGGSGADTLVLQGTVSTTFGARAMPAETVRLLSGTDTSFGAPGTALHSYTLTVLENNLIAGEMVTISAGGLVAGEKLTFDGSRERQGVLHVQAGGGDDVLKGGGASDRLSGGAGADTLSGDAGDDQLFGEDGNDVLSGDAGNDELFGGAGDDVIDDKGTGSDRLDGGDGADRISVTRLAYSADVLSIFGGAGADTITIDAKSSTLAADAGAGDDIVAFTSGANAKLTLGEGSDLLDLTWYRRTAGAVPEILDFQPGAGGDRMELSLFLTYTLSYTAYGINPFTNGYMRLFQSGSDVLLQVHANGWGGTVGAYETVMIFRNADKSLFTAENLDGWAPMNVTGSDAADTITGSVGDDIVKGGGGDDFLRLGQGGTDWVDGGEGNDVVFMGRWLTIATQQSSPFDFSRVHGGAGNDTLILQGPYHLDLGATTEWRNEVTGFETLRLLSGADTTYGPAGFKSAQTSLTIRDSVVAAGATLTVDARGFAADEALHANAGYELDGRVEMFGGAGADILRGSANGADLLSGGDGNDQLASGAGASILLGGTGDDSLIGSGQADRLDGGTGADWMHGGGGDDIYEVDSFGDRVVEASGRGNDEVRTALGSRTDYTQLYRLPDNVEKLTGTSATGQGVQDNGLNNVIVMGAGGDLIVLDGGAGYDAMGLLGNYSIAFDGDDMVGFERLSLFTSGNAAAPNSYTLTMHDSNVAARQQLLVIARSLGSNEKLVFDGTAETNGYFMILSGQAADTISGGAGNDRIYGNLGADQLRGGAGKDLFDYWSAADSTPAAADTILDFTKGDRIDLSAIDADGNAANGNSSFAWLGGGGFTGKAGELRVSQQSEGGNIWVVEADVTGDGVADLLIYLVTQPGFTPMANDFVF